MELRDVATGERFAMNEFTLLGGNDDLISVSLDAEVNEGADSHRESAKRYGLRWRFAIPPLPAALALGNYTRPAASSRAARRR